MKKETLIYILQKIMIIIHLSLCRKFMITRSDIREVIRKYEHNMYISDKEFKTMSLKQFTRILQYSPVRYIPYSKKYFDCDNYSFALMGLMKLFVGDISFGIVWTDTHAFNFFIDKDHKLWFVEPQNNKIVDMINGPIRIMMI